MDVSVIIPVYNAERFLEKCINSVCNQKYVKEIIIVEDASVDNSLVICKELVKKHVPLIRLYQHNDAKNHGVGASRNLGIQAAKCQYIAFLDADDYYLPDRFERDIEIMSINHDVDGVYNALGVHLYDKDEKHRIKFHLTTVKYLIPPEELFEEMDPVGTAGYFHCDTLTVRREIFNKVGLFDEKLELSQDTHMWFRMAVLTSLVAGVIDKPVAVRGVHVGNRVRDSARLTYYRHLMHISLLEWGAENSMSEKRKSLLWGSLCRVYGKINHSQHISKFGTKVRALKYHIMYGVSSPKKRINRGYLLIIPKLIKY